MNAIEIENLHKSFGSLKAVDGISLAVQEGEIFSLLGPNGAGKTTTLAMLSTLLRPDDGDARVMGHSIRNGTMAVKSVLGVVPQDIALYMDLTARENLEFWGRMYGLRGGSLRKRVNEVLETIGLVDRQKDLVGKYSGGMKRRVNIGVALLHTMLAQKRTAKYVRTNFVLALVSFILVIYSTFLTRSGILGDASVHSFTDPGATIYWLLLAILGVLVIVGGVLLVVRNRDLKVQHSDTMFLTRETSLGAGTIALILAAVVTLFGTSLPIFSTTRVEPSFYDQATLPIAVAMVLLIGFSLYTQWEAEDGKEMLRRSMKWIAVSLGAGILLYVAGMREATMLLLACSSIFAFFVNVEIGVKVARGDPRFLGGKLAHVGIALFFLGVIATGKYAPMERLFLAEGKPQQALGGTITYTGYTEQPDGKVAFHVAVERGGSSFTLSPVMFDAGQQGVMKNPDIASSLGSDFYVSPMSFEPHQASASDGDSYTIPKGQTVEIGDAQVTFLKFDMGAHGKEAMARGEGGMSFGSVLEIKKGSATEQVVALAHYGTNQPPDYDPVRSELLGATLQMVGMNVGMQSKESSVTVAVIRPGTAQPQPDVLVIEASVKPFINLLWGGTVIMLAGFALAIVKRSKEN